MWRLFQRLTRGGFSSRVPNENEFRAIIERERRRADRVARPMTLVSFQLSGVDNVRRFKTLTRACQRRLRSTDAFGLMSGGRLGVVLPATDVRGGWLVATDLSRMVRASVEQLACQVQQLPTTLHAPVRQLHAASAVGSPHSNPPSTGGTARLAPQREAALPNQGAERP